MVGAASRAARVRRVRFRTNRPRCRTVRWNVRAWSQVENQVNDRTGVAAQNSRHATASLPADDIDELVVSTAVGVHAGAHLEVCWLMYFQTLFTRL